MTVCPQWTLISPGGNTSWPPGGVSIVNDQCKLLYKSNAAGFAANNYAGVDDTTWHD